MALSQPQLRLVSSIGVGILVGTSLIVIIPEGIEAVSPHGGGHSHTKRGLSNYGLSRTIYSGNGPEVLPRNEIPNVKIWSREESGPRSLGVLEVLSSREVDDHSEKEIRPDHGTDDDHIHELEPERERERSSKDEDGETGIPTFFIGFSLILGFVLMFLIDRLPRHATEHLQRAAAPIEVSLDNLIGGNGAGATTDEESAGFLGGIAPTPKQSRSLATTTGLVIHAAADGIAMGASSSTSNVKLGFIIFIAILIHKAPAAFGLTSVLLKQGLSKRATRGHLLIFSLAAPVGALGTWFLIAIFGGGRLDGDSGQWWTGMLLLFSAGTFL